MLQPLNPEDLAVESLVIGPPEGVEPGPDGVYLASVIWYTNTRPMPATGGGCTIA